MSTSEPQNTGFFGRYFRGSSGAENPTIKIRKLPHSEGLPLPKYATEKSAGLDLLAAIVDDVLIQPGTFESIPTGIEIALPKGTEGQIRPRSGLAAGYGVTVLNSPGTIDEDYRGEVRVLLINHGKRDFVVSRGMRIAQMIVSPCIRVAIHEVTNLDQTVRGTGGFGSTGV